MCIRTHTQIIWWEVRSLSSGLCFLSAFSLVISVWSHPVAGYWSVFKCVKFFL